MTKFKIGDRVKVLEPIDEFEDDWVNKMYDMIGKEFFVRSIRLGLCYDEDDADKERETFYTIDDTENEFIGIELEAVEKGKLTLLKERLMKS